MYTAPRPFLLWRVPSDLQMGCARAQGQLGARSNHRTTWVNTTVTFLDSTCVTSNIWIKPGIFFPGRYLALQMQGIQISTTFSNHITNLASEFKTYVILGPGKALECSLLVPGLVHPELFREVITTMQPLSRKTHPCTLHSQFWALVTQEPTMTRILAPWQHIPL